MAKKRAFVRYSKQGKIVPGSLILTNGSHPNGPSTWNEVPADLCCETTSISACVLTRNTDNFVYPATTGIVFQLAGGNCEGGLGEFNYFNIIVDNSVTVNNINDLVQVLNENFPFYGTFSVSGPEEISLTLLSSLSNLCTCEIPTTLSITNN